MNNRKHLTCGTPSGRSHCMEAWIPDAKDLEMYLRLLMAVALGSTIGIERAFRDKPAGFRTNILICVGACVFTISSTWVSGPNVDQSRIAAQIVSGVGFLGAGAIIRDAKGVVGLTTAATIWSVAALGMAAGLGEFKLAIAGCAGVMFVLVVMPLLANAIELRRDLMDYRIVTPRSQDELDRIEARFAEHGLKIIVQEFFEREKSIVFVIKALGPRDGHHQFRREVLLMDEWRLCEV